MWPSPPSLPAWASSVFSQSFFQALRSFNCSHQDPNDVLDTQSISWQLQHLSPWESDPQRWPQHWRNSSSPLIMSVFGLGGWGGNAEMLGSCGWKGRGRPLCAVKRGRPQHRQTCWQQTQTLQNKWFTPTSLDFHSNALHNSVKVLYLL